MRILILSCMVFLSISVLCASDMLPPEGFMAWAKSLFEAPHANPALPEHKNGEILGHAKSESSAAALPQAAEELEGGLVDPAVALENKKVKDEFSGATVATVSNTVRDELHKQETVEDFKKYPVVSGQGPNEDESAKKTALDLKLLNPNPEGVNAIKNAAPAA